jgi:hypothetical protein
MCVKHHFHLFVYRSFSFNDAHTNLYLVAVHEIGHALGLDHTYNEKSIMFPSYQPMAKSNILPQPDREAIQQLYGKKKASSSSSSSSSLSPSSSTATRSTTTTTTTTTSVATVTQKVITTTKSGISITPDHDSHPRCRRFLDAAVKHPDGTLHTFDSGVLWRFIVHNHTWENRTNTYKQTYNGLPTKLSAGVYDSRAKQFLFFNNNSVFQYDIDSFNRVKYRGEQRLARNLQNSIVGAIYYRSQVYVITRKMMRVYRVNNAYQQTNEQELSEEFPRLKGQIKLAFSYNDQHHFFTDAHLVYVWNERLRTWDTFEKPMENNWFACSTRKTYSTKDIRIERTKRREYHSYSH